MEFNLNGFEPKNILDFVSDVSLTTEKRKENFIKFTKNPNKIKVGNVVVNCVYNNAPKAQSLESMIN